MKALEKDRLRRYDSVGDLAADVQRHLDGNVVLACPPSVGYRLRKLVRRNKGLLTTGVLLVITLLIATGVSVSYAIQADQRLAQSRRDSDRALNSLGVVVEQLSSAEFAQIPGVEDSRDAMLQQALSLYEEIVREHNDDPYARQQQALAYGRMSNILDLTGRSEEAETAINQGIALLEERLKTHPNNRSYRKSLAKLLFRRIHLDGRTQTKQLADAGRMLPIYQQLLRTPSNQFVAAVGLARLKIAERLPEDSARAMELIAESIRLPGEHGLSPHPASYIWLAEHAERHGDFPEAEKNYRRGIEGYDANATAGNRVTRGLQAYNCGRLAKLLNALGRFEEGRDFHLRAIGYARNLYEQYGKLPEYEGHVAWYVGNYFKDATTEQQQQEALKLLEEFTVKWPEAALLHSKRADCLAESDDAMAGLSNAIEQFPQQYIYCRRRSVLYLELDEFELALADLKQATDAKPDYYHTRYQLAVMSLSADDRAAYDDACQKMLTDFANSDVPDEMHFAAWTCALTTDAVEDYAPAISLARHCADGEPNHRQFLNGLGAILMRAGKYAEARTQLEKGLAAPDSDSTSPAYAHYFLAMTEHHQGHQQAATQ
ncbi:MAG: hypothetical protein GY826_27230, partial [Fuerstiella sp.]|nr:hypothetical protein [Fuerstiella sp.]